MFAILKWGCKCFVKIFQISDRNVQPRNSQLPLICPAIVVILHSTCSKLKEYIPGNWMPTNFACWIFKFFLQEFWHVCELVLKTPLKGLFSFFPDLKLLSIHFYSNLKLFESPEQMVIIFSIMICSTPSGNGPELQWWFSFLECPTTAHTKSWAILL